MPAKKTIPWPDSVAAIVAVISLVVNGVLGVQAYKLSVKADDREQQLSDLDNNLKNFELLKWDRESDTLLETRILVLTGMALFNISSAGFEDNEKTIPVQKNSVLISFEQLKDELGYGNSPIEKDENQRTLQHGIVVLKITNYGSHMAENVKLNTKMKTSSSDGSDDENLWELNSANWGSQKLSLADLKPGESVIVPLGHVLGTSHYFGSFFVPESISCWNPFKKMSATINTARIVKSDQWLSAGLNISVAQ